MKKRMLAAVLAGLMIIGMAAGCGKKPVVTLGQYKGLEVTDVTQEELDTEMAAILESYAELVAVDRAAAEGDTVNINYVGKLDGEAFEGGTEDSEEGFDLELGSNSFIDGFEEGLVGTVAGQTLDLNLTFPDPYENNPDLAGKAVVFTVTVNAVKELQTPELTDGFVLKNFEGRATTTEELWAVLREEMSYSKRYSQIMEMVIENSTVENAPEDEIAEAAASMVSYYTTYANYYASAYGMDMESILYYFMGFESTEALEAYALEMAEETVCTRLILLEIASIEGIAITDEIYAEKAQELAENNGYEDIATMEEENEKEDIENAMLADLVVDFLLEQAVIVTE